MIEITVLVFSSPFYMARFVKIFVRTHLLVLRAHAQVTL